VARLLELGLRPLWLVGTQRRQPGRGRGHGGLAPGHTGAREAVERRRDDGEGSGGGALASRSLEAWREGKEGQGRSGEERECWDTLL
jgi:hypothetical protein